MEPQTIPIPNGTLTCQVRLDRADIELEVRPDRPGLYRGSLTGPAGQWDLGLLLPENGRLGLRRTLAVSGLEKAGCWPVTGAKIRMTHPFGGGAEPAAPPGWRQTADPSACFPRDPVLARAAGETAGWLLCRGTDGSLSLAAPWAPARPFPMVPAFCFARVREMTGRRWVIYRFSGEGLPVSESLDNQRSSH